MVSIIRRITTLGILGSGQMGTGIGLVGANTANLSVKIYDTSESQKKKSEEYITTWLTKKSKLESLKKIEYQSSLDFIPECDFVIEAIPEIVEEKTKLLGIVSSLMKDSAILASNTSSISITKLAKSSKFPDKVIGMHFMRPVEVMTLVEVIRGLHTSDETHKTTIELAKAMGKTTSNSKDTPGFIINKLLIPYINEAIFVLYEGVASREDIDITMKLGANTPMGPLRLADFIGLDTVFNISKVIFKETGDPKYRPCSLLSRYVDAGWLGVKSGKGFYEYPRN